MKRSNGGWVAALGVLAIVVVGGVYVASHSVKTAPTSGPSSVQASSQVASSTNGSEQAEPPIEHPIEQASVVPVTTATVPLPALNGSDDSVIATLSALTGDSDLSSLLIQPQVVQRIVATVDALPRRGLNRVMLPVQSPKGSFATEDAANAIVMSLQNDARYVPYMNVLQSADSDQLVAWYVHAYPLFQQAYRELGYPKGYFNDRLIVAIDDLLAAPDLEQRPGLVLSNGYYRYTDPALESLSAGQRAMLRAGPENEATLKSRLLEIRGRLVGHHFHKDAAPASTASAG